MEAMPSATGEFLLQMVFFSLLLLQIFHRFAGIMIVARISNNVAWVTSWRATVPSSVSGALSVRIGGI